MLSAEKINLEFWAEELAVTLGDFHIGHIETYRSTRKDVADWEIINSEVSSLLHLLDAVGSSKEIREYYRPLHAPDKLSDEERNALPERAQRYIKLLERQIKSLDSDKHKLSDRLRKANWARWTR